jgi:hypothetical protein
MIESANFTCARVTDLVVLNGKEDEAMLRVLERLLPRKQ